MTASETTWWNFFNQKSTTQTIRLVSVGDFPYLLASDGSATFSVPGGPQNLHASGKFITEKSNGDFVWWGELTDHTGYVAVAQDSSQKFVSVMKGSEFYEIHPLSSRYNALIKINNNAVMPDLCPPSMTVPENITSNPPNNCTNDITECKATVSVLVLVTPEALAAIGYQPNQISSVLYLPVGLNSINFALVNSGIFGKSFRFIVEDFDFDFSGLQNIITDLDLLETDGNADALREAHQADLMVLLTDNRYSNALGVWREYFSAPGYFGIVSIENLFGVRNVFAHEVGHAFSCNHNRVSNGGDEPYDGSDVCQFGWRFEDQASNDRATIMVPLRTVDYQNGASQILNYSNPDVEFNGAPTGTIIDKNAYHISHRMCVVDDYFEAVELRVGIDGPLETCNELVDYDAEFLFVPPAGEPGSGPFTFSWWKSTTGFFNPLNGSNNPPPVFLGNTPSIQILANQDFWLKLDVCGNGACANHVIKVENCSGAAQRAPSGTRALPNEMASALAVWPNPGSDFINLSLSPSGTAAISYQIMNALGQVIQSEQLGSGNLSGFKIPIHTIQPGVYYISIKSENTILTRTFSIAR